MAASIERAVVDSIDVAALSRPTGLCPSADPSAGSLGDPPVAPGGSVRVDPRRLTTMELVSELPSIGDPSALDAIADLSHG